MGKKKKTKKEQLEYHRKKAKDNYHENKDEINRKRKKTRIKISRKKFATKTIMRKKRSTSYIPRKRKILYLDGRIKIYCPIHKNEILERLGYNRIIRKNPTNKNKRGLVGSRESTNWFYCKICDISRQATLCVLE